MYNPIETHLLRRLVKQVALKRWVVKMLVAQAKIQFELWTGKTPSASILCMMQPRSASNLTPVWVQPLGCFRTS